MKPAGSTWSRPAVIVLTAVLIVLLGAIARVLTGIDAAYTDLLYLVLIPTAYWYRRHAVYPGILVAVLHIVATYIVTGHVGAETLVRAGMLIVIPYVLGYFFEVVGRRTEEKHFHAGESAPTCPV
ncbi:MAG TPA: HEAT repeat domain-containing protein, partial [Methanoculleus sp.]|nr:HEAT repeat domain-containing protein [Methanoculleus sp.]